MRMQCSVWNQMSGFSSIRLISIGIFLAGVTLLVGSVLLGWGHLNRPGPGFFPAGLGGGVILCGVGLWRHKAPVPAAPAAWWGGVATGVGLLCFTAGVLWVGWVPAIAATVLGTSSGDLRWRWPQRWWYAVGCAGLGWLVFDVGLGVPWPAWQRPW